MLGRGDFSKDRIQSYFSRPDRTVNYGRIHNIESGRIGRDIERASEEELEIFVRDFGKAPLRTPTEVDPLSAETLTDLLKVDPARPDRLLKDESDLYEAKETFHTRGAQFAKYAKTAAGLANAGGGYIVFGVKDETLEIVGLPDGRFASTDKADLTMRFDQLLAPAIRWDRTSFVVAGKVVGVIYVYTATRKPIISRMDTEGLRDGAIYYRYVGSTRDVRSAELNEILGSRDRRAGEDFSRLISRVSNIGVENIGLLDVDTGRVEGTHGTFLIDEDLLPKLRFVKEGEFSETTGAPTLRLIGEVEPIETPKPTTIVVRGHALSEHDIVRNFIQQRPTDDPKQYIRLQLHLQYKLLPLFFFAANAALKKDTLIKLIEEERDVSKYTANKISARVLGLQLPTESRKNYEEIITKLLAGEMPRVTPENAIKLAKAVRAMKYAEIASIDVFKLLKSLLVAYDESPDHGFYSQLRITASYVDDIQFRNEVMI
jgi:hypothetical protein